MEEFIQNILIGVRQWVNGKLEDITYVISSHINELTGRISTAETNISNKVDKVEGKGLSTEDYTTAEKTKLSNVAEGAQVNVLESISAADNSVTIGTVSGKDQTVAVKLSADADNAITLESDGLKVAIPAATVTGVKSSEKIIGLDGTELTSTLSIAIEKQSNIDYIVLKGKNNEEVSKVDASAFVADGMLDAAGFYRYHAAVADPSTPAYWELVSGDDIAGHGSASEATTWTQTATDGQEYIVLKWNTAASSKMTFIDAAGLVDDYTAGTGISITNRVVSLNAAGTTAATIGGVYVEDNSGLTLAADGKLSIDAPTVAQVLAVLNAPETAGA